MQRQQSRPISPLAIGNQLRLNGGDVWWQHTIGKSERDHLDNLMGLALVDQKVRDRLLIQHDPKLLDDFELSDDTRHRLMSVQAHTLRELAEAVVKPSIPTGQTSSR